MRGLSCLKLSNDLQSQLQASLVYSETVSQNKETCPAAVGHMFKPNTREAVEGGSWGQPGLQSELQDSQGCLEKPNTHMQNKKNCEFCVRIGFYLLGIIIYMQIP